MKTVGIVGGTGAMGSALGARFAVAGRDVLLGGRDTDKARDLAAELVETWGPPAKSLSGGSIADAFACEIVIIATPWPVTAALCADHGAAAAGSLVLSAVNRFRFIDGVAIPLADGTSAAQSIKETMPGSRIVTAFNHLPARVLHDRATEIHADVFLCGDDSAFEEAASLISEVQGLRPIEVGGFEAAGAVEDFATVLINVNRRNRASASVRLAGIE